MGAAGAALAPLGVRGPGPAGWLRGAEVCSVSPLRTFWEPFAAAGRGGRSRRGPEEGAHPGAGQGRVPQRGGGFVPHGPRCSPAPPGLRGTGFSPSEPGRRAGEGCGDALPGFSRSRNPPVGQGRSGWRRAGVSRLLSASPRSAGRQRDAEARRARRLGVPQGGSRLSAALAAALPAERPAQERRGPRPAPAARESRAPG